MVKGLGHTRFVHFRRSSLSSLRLSSLKPCPKFKHFKLGDTLVEVSIAIGIFSMVAIATVSVINASTSSSQGILENTITREELDAQAEALRFIQSAYVAGGELNSSNTAANKYASLWSNIAENAIVFDENTPNELYDIITNYNPTTCSALYSLSDTANLINQHAFIINTRAMGYESSNIADTVNTILIRPTSDNLQKVFRTADTFPRIIYNNTTSGSIYDQGEDASIASGSNFNINAAEGIFVVAVRDSEGTIIVSDETGNVAVKSAYIDFYIRSCWVAPSSDRPTTISTVIRLYDPDAISINKYEKKGIFIKYDGNGATKGGLPDQYVVGFNFTTLINNFEKPSARFINWRAGDTYYEQDKTYALPSLPEGGTLTLIANWQEYKRTVKFNNDGCPTTPSGSMLSIDLMYNLPPHEVQLINNFSCSYYGFDGWSTTPGGAKVYNATDWIRVTAPLEGDEEILLYTRWKPNVYKVNLNSNGATSAGSTTADATYHSMTLSTITPPTKAYTVSGFTRTASAANSSISSANTLTSTYTFNGWHTAASGGSKVASSAATPVLQAGVPNYTDANARWVRPQETTLYAQWGDSNNVTLPTITRTGSTCGWSKSSTATTWDYDSGKTISGITSNITLYGVCRNNIMLGNDNATETGSTSATVNYGSTSLSSITLPKRKYSVYGFDNGANAALATVSSRDALTSTYDFNGWYTAASGGTKVADNSTTPALTASNGYTNANKQWTYTTASAVTLHAQWNSKSVKLPTISREGYNCGWGTSNNTIIYGSGATITPEGDLPLYGVCAAKNYTVTLNGNGATSTNHSTSTTVSYNATALGSITVPKREYTVSGFTAGTNASGATISSTATLTSAYTFNGWYNAASGGGKVASTDATPALQASVTGYTNASKQWIKADAATLYAQWTSKSITLPTITKTGYACGWSTSSTATSYSYNSGATITPDSNTGSFKLYGICVANSYSITLDNNGATKNGSTSTTVKYGATTFASSIAIPERKYTISFNANNHTASYTDTKYPTYTFDGWYKGGTKIATNTTTPTFTASNGLTNASGQWISTSNQALIANWSGGSLALPTITLTGNTCRWNWIGNGIIESYASGTTITPTKNMLLIGSCSKNNYSLAINFAGSGVYSVEVRTASGAGGTLMGTVSSSGGSVSGLVYGTTYYLRPIFNSGYGLDNWAKISGSGTLSSTTAANPTFTIGAGNDTIRITGKSTITEYCTSSDSNCMQYYTKSTCQSNAASSNVTLKDARDNNTYTVRYINNNCWMTQNLRLGGGTTVTSKLSNVSSNYTLPNSNCDSYTNGCLVSGKDGNGGSTVWYNYCAATAGTVCSQTENGSYAYDICPKGWRLPTRDEVSGIINNSATWQPVLGNQDVVPIGGGGEGNGFWWTTTVYGSSQWGVRQWLLQYYYSYSSEFRFQITGYWNERNYRHYVRCLLK